MAPQPDAPPFDHFNARLELLCREWDLGLEPKVDYSPRKGGKTLQDECYSNIRLLFYKGLLNDALEKFRSQATILYSGWVHKPRAERGVVPDATRDRPRPVTSDEREELLKCLARVLREERDIWMKANGVSPTKDSVSRNVDDTPVSFSLNSKGSDPTKRRREEAFADLPIKKPKKPTLPLSKSFDTMPPPDRGRSVSTQAPRSANTSFTSNASSASVFSRNPSTFPSTQETLPDDEPSFQTQETRESFMTPQEKKSSDYASSSFEARVADVPESDVILNGGSFGQSNNDITDIHVNEELSQDLGEFGIAELKEKEEEIIERLQSVFPQLPESLKAASLAVIYEITRVFLHAGVPLDEFDAPVTSALDDYDTLWSFLKSLPALKWRAFPERCGNEVWAAALNGFSRGPHAVVFAGSLHFNTSTGSSLLRLQLAPLKLDRSHRLGRRFGHDRFFEIITPEITGAHVPPSLAALKDCGSNLIYDWLVDTAHPLLGRSWQPFHSKPKDRDRRGRRQEASKAEKETSFRVYFFATSGYGFCRDREVIYDAQYKGDHPVIPISVLLNRIRPIRKNESQPALKLFARTDLVVSRNSATAVLTPSQIRFRKKDITFGPNNEAMNDGAGRISPALANEVKRILGLSYLPSAFQGRIGEAKGLWVIDHTCQTDEHWIEIYPKQQKWKRSTKRNGESEDVSHRTFEVLKCSSQLRSADLNTQFLDLLMARARDRTVMKKAIQKLFEDGLAQKLSELQVALEDLPSFRQWVRNGNSNATERIKVGGVPYRAGLPVTLEERLNGMLEAGFDPRLSIFVKEMAKDIFKYKCDDMKERLNITVGQSTYAYMVPDFWGVLEPDEVYLDFSSFVDDVSGFSGEILRGKDILVARSPAHFVSDIQKVRAVAKEELWGLKDVIVFSTKGNPSLAAKLSGGDYDGDMAWICWDASIVNNFVNADVPKKIDLVNEGFICQDSRTYSEVVAGHSDPTSTFLKHCLAFNMRRSLLGQCTVYKEEVCYTANNWDSEEARYLSQLLSDLVDLPKSGFIFGEEEWNSFKQKKVQTKPWKPLYKQGDIRGEADNIRDYLKYVAYVTIDKALEDLHKSLPDVRYWDDDLAAPYKRYREEAVRFPEWDQVLNHLDDEIRKMKDDWTRRCPKGVNSKSYVEQKNAESKEEFIPLVLEFYERFHKIQPVVEAPHTRALQIGFGNPELSKWSLLKASALFASYSKQYVANMVFWLAGKQFLRIKADTHPGGTPHSVTPGMYITLKSDAALIRRMRTAGREALAEECASIANVDDLEELEDE